MIYTWCQKQKNIYLIKREKFVKINFEYEAIRVTNRKAQN